MKPTIWLICILFFALLARVYNIMHGIGAHPDERHIVMSAMRLSLDDMNPATFAYGSLPFYLLWAFSNLLSGISDYYKTYDGFFFIGRSLSAIFGTATVFLSYLIGTAVYKNKTIGLLAAALLAANVFHLQLSRFTTVDVMLTAFTMLALLWLIQFTSSGSLWKAAGAGVAIGLAVATKLSALYLLLPLLASFVVYAQTKQKWLDKRALLAFFVSLAIIPLTLLLVQPYMFFDFSTYLKHNLEQINMVRGNWRPPYTIQYENTLPYFYHLKQMFFYTMGPPLAIATLAGLILSVVTTVKRPFSAATILLFLVLPVFGLVGGSQVKFPRYLLPLYPVLFIFAAFLLVKIAESLRFLRNPVTAWLPTFIILAWSAIYSLGFINIYSEEHVYRLASKWMYDNIEPNSKILQVHHWDDILPLHLPDRSPTQYSVRGPEFELPLYDIDTRKKFEDISIKLSSGDYIVFPTARLYGALSRVPDEFPYSNAFFQLLFNNNLGYEIVQTFKVRPSLGKITFNNDLADESLTVYDHPKVVVFKNIHYLTSDEIAMRIFEPEQFSPLPDRNWIMKINTGNQFSYRGERTVPEFTFLKILLWFFSLQILSLVVLPLLRIALPNSPDAGYGISKVIGLLFLGYFSWLIPHLGIAPFGRETVWLVFLALVAVALLIIINKFSLFSDSIRRARKHIVPVEILFLGGAAIFLLIRAYHPEIFWGEKTMNLSFLNYLIRLDYPPPHDPWAAGNIMGYYYLSTHFFASMHHLTGLDSGVGYNVSIATIAGLLMAACYSAIVWLTHRRGWAFAGAAAVTLMSNPEVLNLVLFSERKVDWHLFWASARLFTAPAINEYPLWTLLFADLHAHLITYPFVVALMVIGSRFIEKGGNSLNTSNLTNRVLFGFLLGCLFALNSWDAVSFSLITALLLLSPIFCMDWTLKNRAQIFWNVTGTSFANGVILSVVAILSILPFLLTSSSADRLHWGWVHGEFDEGNQLFRHFGHWLIILVSAMLIMIFRNYTALQNSRYWPLLRAMCWAAIPFALGAWSYYANAKDLPWGVLTVASIMLALSSMACWRSEASVQVRLIGIFVTAAALIITFTQLLFLMDRMNTIFKFYNIVWFLLGVSAMGAMPYLTKQLWHRPAGGFYTFLTRSWLALIFAGLLVGALGFIINVGITVSYQRVPGPRPTLNGEAYLHRVNPDEGALISWLKNSVSGTPVQLEAQGPPYGPFTRIAMHTGLPTVLGFEHHVRQRGSSHVDVRERKEAIQEIYSTENVERAVELLQRYKVRYIIVSKLEYDTYPEAGLQKFIDRNDLFRPVFESGESRVFELLR